LVQEIASSALPQSDIPPGVCATWQKMSNDAGWAGAVADALLNGRSGSMSVIYPLQTDTLALVNEVFRLIPPDKRWNITFSTYYSSPIPGSTCDLRFVLDGTTDAEAIRRD
jgi:hypothetical protein